MRLNLRLLAAIWLTIMVVLGAFAYVSVARERTRLSTEMERRAWLLGEGLKEAVEPLIDRGSRTQLERIIQRFGTAARGVAVYDRSGSLVAVTSAWADLLQAPLPAVGLALTDVGPRQGFHTLSGRETHYYVVPLVDGQRARGALVILQDATHIDRELGDMARLHAIRFAVLVILLSLVTLVVVRRSVTHPLRRLAEWAHQLRAGQPVPPPPIPDSELFGPLATEVSDLGRTLAKARMAIAEEARLRLRGEAVWTEERLAQFSRARLGDRPLVVVSNREPVSHVWRGRQVVSLTPASGVVTAMEPVMRACGGVWIAHASGDADREGVDERGMIKLPPEAPRYSLKRIWLSEDEEAGYYYGFANEGIWPLCHNVHARPTFRPEDWRHYAAVNAKFADAVLEVIAETDDPAVLIQDYHFALLPRFIKDKRPDAHVGLFWHIPWPNPEAFGICPWQTEILDGMLGADLVGFHTQFHCNNFLETVDRAVEARIDWEHFSVVRSQHVTLVKPFPISVAPRFIDEPPATSRAALLQELGIDVEFLGVGVERIDYTKGLPERFAAIRRFFTQHPGYRGRLTFVQLAAPSRSRIPRYQALEEELDQLAGEINGELGSGSWRPIVLLKGHHDHRSVWPFYRWADFCTVTSLHDGMNLVAKEFVSVRDDEDGVLILSRFTGAARELRDALLVNPYDVDEMAEAIRRAVEMPPGERRSRMARMRQTVREYNIYRWAGRLLGELARLPDHGDRGPTLPAG
ncbi:MAG TPA: trehalose-6-phosphate synthase [Solirubrobacterales bacterium]|nr:trehalose-6-phosphate synthase [Solirubrobacterales bacterium]